MKENVNQSLSAMLDNESESFEVRRTLEQLDDDSRATWARYQAVSATLKGEKAHTTDLSLRVREALEDEPEFHIKSQGNGFLSKPVASVAVAASVTAMVIFGVQSFQTDTGMDGQLAEQSSGIVLPSPQPISASVTPANFGDLRAPQASYQQADIIRMTPSSDRYISQHESMLTGETKQWSAGWLPEGYQALSYAVHNDAEVLRYTNGESIISVFVEPDTEDKVSGNVVKDGETLALGKKVSGQYVTVVGDMPLMTADRIASAVQPLQ